MLKFGYSLLLKRNVKPGTVIHVCNLSMLGGLGRRVASPNNLETLAQNLKMKRAGTIVQCEGSRFNFQHHRQRELRGEREGGGGRYS